MVFLPKNPSTENGQIPGCSFFPRTRRMGWPPTQEWPDHLGLDTAIVPLAVTVRALSPMHHDKSRVVVPQQYALTKQHGAKWGHNERVAHAKHCITIRSLYIEHYYNKECIQSAIFYMQIVLIIQCFICKVSLLCTSALYAKCPYYVVLYMQSVLIM